MADIRKPIDLAVIVAPVIAVPSILHDERAQLRTAIIMSAPSTSDGAMTPAWRSDVAAVAAARNVRLLGPGAFGVVRTDIGLNATFCAPPTLRGRLALVSQSGAVCTAMLDFAAPMRIGFSSVISLGGGIDVGFGELLDSLLLDAETEGILLYVESIADARKFMSALRAAARTKPVVVLKAGRSLESGAREVPSPSIAPWPDEVFEAALMRSGTVRVRTYAQLFAAARVLAMGERASGDRLAIVSNGRAPALLAADSAFSTGVALARFGPVTVSALNMLLPKAIARANPLDLRGDAPPERLAGAMSIILSDPEVDAVIALHAPRPTASAIDAARAVAAVVRASKKPVLGSWLGAINRPDVHDTLESSGVANFFTPENAVEAFSFLAAYRRNQEWLLETPNAQVDTEPPDIAAANRILAGLLHKRAAAREPVALPAAASRELLAAFHITVSEDVAANEHANGSRGGVNHGSPPAFHGPAIRLAVATDAVFGPVIVLAPAAQIPPMLSRRTVMLPPLNRRLAEDMIAGARDRSGVLRSDAIEPLIRLLLQVSALVCALPWVRELSLDPVAVLGGRVEITAARIVVDPQRSATGNYNHMAIHPYPRELEAEVQLADGTRLLVRPIRPEDAELERIFVASLSEQTRFFRFFYRLHELTPAMLARFTQVDYGRELALLALTEDMLASEGTAIVGIARYIANPDHESAEFAVVVGDAWQGRGVGTMLLERLIAAAKRHGFKRLQGAVLRANEAMLTFAQRRGFTLRSDQNDPEQVAVVLELD
ncbi:MAG: GNAT family N-acetyltransferase [Betaproteobacteria bacterium]|nr:GNAT family N-acetyltransferase [Betaproteobacteria bacterium]